MHFICYTCDAVYDGTFPPFPYVLLLNLIGFRYAVLRSLIESMHLIGLDDESSVATQQ
jgi:hypothetical protein